MPRKRDWIILPAASIFLGITAAYYVRQLAAGAADATSSIELIIIFTVYFLPGLIAAARGHHRRVEIAMLNLLLGWTAIGWIAALVWSFGNTSRDMTEQERGRAVVIASVSICLLVTSLFLFRSPERNGSAAAADTNPALQAQERQTFALACAGRAVARAQLGDLTSDYHEKFLEDAEISAVADGENIWHGAAAARVDRLKEKYRGPGLDYACHQLLLSRRASR